MKNKISFALFCAFGFAFAGCVHEKNESAHRTVITESLGGTNSPGTTTIYDLENDRILFMDKGVKHSVSSAGIQERIKADGRLEVAANIRNRENRRIQVQINCVFQDEQGFSTGDETPWQNLILTENSQETVKFVSMNNLARRYNIRIRQAR